MDKRSAREIYKLLAKIDKVCRVFTVGGCEGCPMNGIHAVTENGGITMACNLIDWARVYDVDKMYEEEN